MWDLIMKLVDLITGGLMSRLDRQRTRVETFRSAFAGAIGNLSLPDANDRFILQGEFSVQYEAYNALRIHLSERKKKKLDDAWRRYEAHYRARVNEVGVFEFFATEILDPARMKDPAHHEEVRAMRCQQALDLIHDLLKSV